MLTSFTHLGPLSGWIDESLQCAAQPSIDGDECVGAGCPDL
jgi:hypothetical protein